MIKAHSDGHLNLETQSRDLFKRRMENTNYLAYGKDHSKSRQQQVQEPMSWRQKMKCHLKTLGTLANWEDYTIIRTLQFYSKKEQSLWEASEINLLI